MITLVEADVRPAPGLVAGLQVISRIRHDNSIRLILGSTAELALVTDTSAIPIAWGPQYTPDKEFELHREKETHLSHRFILDRSTLNHLETARAGGGPRLDVRVALHGVNLEPRDPPGFRFTLHAPLEIDAGRWVTEYLPRFRYDVSDAWERRLEPLRRLPDLGAEHQYLDSAVRDFNRGTPDAYQDAFTDVRNMFLNLRNRKAELKLEGRMGKEEWSRAIAFLSMPMHPEIGATIRRSDAELAITTGRAFLRHLTMAISPQPEANQPLTRPRALPATSLAARRGGPGAGSGPTGRFQDPPDGP